MVYDGEPSSAFLLRAVPDGCHGGCTGDSERGSRGQSILLIDCGLGVVRACLQHVDALPSLIYVSHNHTDHAGELPVVLAVERTRPGGSKRTVVAERRVAEVLKERRLYETTAVGAYDADWIILDVGKVTPIGQGLAMMPVGPCQHTELCFGFVLYAEDAGDSSVGQQALFGFTADSGFCGPIIQQLAEAPLILADARQAAMHEHASFEELWDWRATNSYAGRLVIYHYGALAEAPHFESGLMEVAHPGEIVARWDSNGQLLPI
mmetsp:Transcript_6379/g.8156  ORF Transcript_6379/g.8156 Transcript_6379/m.8156 type:complete len:264 (-) Transcript_6379:86-877(-)